jgi:hypothetical protein
MNVMHQRPDAFVLYEFRRWGLNRLAKKHGLRLRQSYLRLAKRAAMMASRYASCAHGSAASFATSAARSPASRSFWRFDGR